MSLDSLLRVCSPAQIRSIHEAQRVPQIGLWAGAVSSGKTIASLIAFLLAVATAPDHGLIVIVGRTLQTIERNVLDPLQSGHLFGLLARHVHHTTGSNTATILGRTVHLVGASDARAEGRIRGATIALAYVDEATLVPQAFWMMLLSRLRVPNAKLMATTNPDGPGHWLKRDFIDRADEIGMRYWHFTLDDNPSLEPSYVERLKAQYVGLWYRRFIEGAWCLAEGAVFDSFDEQRHVVDHMPAIERWLTVGVDYGTVNPFAALAIGIGGPVGDRRLYVASEYRHDSRTARRQLTDAEYSLQLRQWLDTTPRPGENGRGIWPERLYIDPSAASFMTQLWRDKFPGVTAADNSVLDGIRTVSSLFAYGRLLIHRSAVGLLTELPGYSWDDKAAERGEDKPLKINDHSVDALRYGVHSSAWLWRPLLPRDLALAA